MAFTFANVDIALDIANNAMLQLGHNFFEGSDLDDAATIADSDNEHVAMYKNFHPSVKAVLRSAPWPTVSKLGKLSALSDADIEYMASYTLPTDYIRLNGVILNGVRYRSLDVVPVPFRRRGNTFVTNFDASVYLDYVYYPVQSATEAVWDAYFTMIDSDATLREAIEAYLAYKLSYPLKKDANVKQSMYDLWLEHKAVAQVLAKEDSHQMFTPPGAILEERMRTR